MFYYRLIAHDKKIIIAELGLIIWHQIAFNDIFAQYILDAPTLRCV